MNGHGRPLDSAAPEFKPAGIHAGGASADAFSDMLRNPNVPPQLKEAFRLSQVAKQSGDMATQERADELVRAAILQGGPEIQKRFEEALGEMSTDARVTEQLNGASMPSAKDFLAGKGLVPESFLS